MKSEKCAGPVTGQKIDHNQRRKFDEHYRKYAWGIY
jgi:hypothetical protein